MVALPVGVKRWFLAGCGLKWGTFQVFPVLAGGDRKRLLWFVAYLLFQVKGGIGIPADVQVSDSAGQGRRARAFARFPAMPAWAIRW
jgi:hypothetical protein